MEPQLSLQTRRQRLRIRARHRGILELCVLLERYIEVANLHETAELSAFESLLEETDRDIEAWLSGLTIWPHHHTYILGKITATLNLPAPQ